MFQCSHACHMCLVLFLPVQSLLTCLRTSYSLCGLCLSVSSLITLPQTVTLAYISLHSQDPQWRYSVLPFLRSEVMTTVTNLPLHIHYGITLCAYLSQTHRHIELRNSVTLWAYLAEPVVRDSHLVTII